MLFSEEETSFVSGNGVLWGAVGSLVTAFGTWILAVYNAKTKNKRETRIDAMAEVWKLVDKLNERVAFLENHANSLQDQIVKLTEAHAQCRAENDSMQDKISHMEVALEKMRQRQRGNPPTGFLPPDPKKE